MNRTLVCLGLLCLAAGLFWPWLRKLPFERLGRLPGDFSFIRDNVQFFFPLGTCLLLSLVVTILFWIFRK